MTYLGCIQTESRPAFKQCFFIQIRQWKAIQEVQIHTYKGLSDTKIPQSSLWHWHTRFYNHWKLSQLHIFIFHCDNCEVSSWIQRSHHNNPPGMCACMFVIGLCSSLLEKVMLRWGKSWSWFNFFARRPCIVLLSPLCWYPCYVNALAPFKWMRGLHAL